MEDDSRTEGMDRGGSLLLSNKAMRFRRLLSVTGEGILLVITSMSMLAVLLIIAFVAYDAIPFFRSQGFSEFFGSTRWYPSRDPAEFGAKSLFFGSAIVTGGAILFAVPVGVCAAICLSDILSYSVRDIVKPVVEILASIPSVAFGFFALVVLAPLLQNHGGSLLGILILVAGIPVLLVGTLIIGEVLADHLSALSQDVRKVLIVGFLFVVSMFLLYMVATHTWGLSIGNWKGVLVVVGVAFALFAVLFLFSEAIETRFSALEQNTKAGLFMGVLFLGGGFFLYQAAVRLWDLQIRSGTNVLNVSLILGVMALPTIVSVSEDALQAVGKELRMAAYGLGATRSEMLLKVVVPAASSGILAAVILGIMRAVGETMVVWMASGNAAQIPTPWYDLTAPIRTLTATIAGDMGEADHVTGSDRYHVLFALALALLLFSLIGNLVSEWVIKRNRARLRGE